MAHLRDTDHLSERIESLRAELKDTDPFSVAARTGVEYNLKGEGGGEFRLPLWDRPVVVSFPDLRARDAQTCKELSSSMQALLLYYFRLSDGTLQTERWISFSELPDGRFYNQAFQGYSGKVLAREFQNDLGSFRQAAEKVGGQQYTRSQGLGDAAFAFQVLPQVWLLVVYWCGDEDFPASCQILFDDTVGHHLSTDACAMLGSILTQRIIKVKEG